MSFDHPPHPFFGTKGSTCELCDHLEYATPGEHIVTHPHAWTFLLYVDREGIPHVTEAEAQAFLEAALERQARWVDEGPRDETALVLSRAITLVRVDLQEEAATHSKNIEAAAATAEKQATLRFARQLPGHLHGAKLDALIDAYVNALEKRASVVILFALLVAHVRRWWHRRRNKLPVSRHAK